MSMPHQRLRDPQPLSRGGEVAFIVLAGAVLLLGFAALAGLSAASALFGGGWVWPHGTTAFGQLLGGLLSGHPGQGLPGPSQDRLPGRLAVYSCIAVAELLMLSAAGTPGVFFYRYHRPADACRGMATRTEAEQVLGRSRLRRARHLLRPDLTGRTEVTSTVASSAGGGSRGPR